MIWHVMVFEMIWLAEVFNTIFTLNALQGESEDSVRVPLSIVTVTPEGIDEESIDQSPVTLDVYLTTLELPAIQETMESPVMSPLPSFLTFMVLLSVCPLAVVAVTVKDPVGVVSL